MRTPVPLHEGGLIGVPAAVLVVEPEAVETHATLEISHPVGGDVDATGECAYQAGERGVEKCRP